MCENNTKSLQNNFFQGFGMVCNTCNVGKKHKLNHLCMIYHKHVFQAGFRMEWKELNEGIMYFINLIYTTVACLNKTWLHISTMFIILRFVTSICNKCTMHLCVFIL